MIRGDCTCPYRKRMEGNPSYGIALCHRDGCPRRDILMEQRMSDGRTMREHYLHSEVITTNTQKGSSKVTTTTDTTATFRPRVLVMEGLSGSGSCVRVAGGIPVHCGSRMSDSVIEAIDARDYDALLLTGGGDVNPRAYGKKPHPKVYGVDDLRDYAETHALRTAREMGIPVLGICRGSQIMTVEAGGMLRQHIRGHYGSHPVVVEPGSTLAKATAGELRPTVKSLHHQEVQRPGAGFKVSGRAPDGTVEAVETEDGRCLGVQFHPEMHQQSAYARAIFRWLVCEGARRAGHAAPPVPAEQRQLPGLSAAAKSRKRKAPSGLAKVSWFCPFEGIRFDNKTDQQDHLRFIHGVEVDEATGRIQVGTTTR